MQFVYKKISLSKSIYAIAKHTKCHYIIPTFLKLNMQIFLTTVVFLTVCSVKLSLSLYDDDEYIWTIRRFKIMIFHIQNNIKALFGTG